MYSKLSEQYYWEFHPNKDPFNYYYYIQVGETDYHITADGMSIASKDGSAITTNATPKKLFPDNPFKLTDDQLLQLLDLPVEGKYQSRKQMDKLYQMFKKS